VYGVDDDGDGVGSVTITMMINCDDGGGGGGVGSATITMMLNCDDDSDYDSGDDYSGVMIMIVIKIRR